MYTHHVEIGSKRYKDGVDGGVVPYAIQAASAAKVFWTGFEHKQSTADKDILDELLRCVAAEEMSSVFDCAGAYQ